MRRHGLGRAARHAPPAETPRDLIVYPNVLYSSRPPAALKSRTRVRRGWLVVIVGPDGVGKTTVARALIEHYPGPTAYFHFLPSMRGTLSAGPDVSSVPPPKARRGPYWLLGWVRLIKNAVRCWVGYLKSVRPALKRNCLVIGDRWMYGYVVQPHSLKFSGPSFLARAILRLLPQPDLVVNLAASAHVVRARKQELSVVDIEQELRAWPTLPFVNLQTFDATRPPQLIAQEILSVLGLSARTNDGEHCAYRTSDQE